MNKKITRILIGLGLAVALIGGAALIGGKPTTPMMPNETVKEAAMAEVNTEMKTEMAPAIKLLDLDGNEVDVAALKGEKVYVKFWASWCSICLAGMDELNQLAAQDNGFKVITIVSPGINGEQEKADFVQWFKSLEYKNIQVLLDETGEVTKAYGVRAYPTSVFIDAEGGLMRTQPGHVSNDRIKAVFEGIE